MVPDFEMIIIGDGEEKKLVLENVRQHPWIHYVGRLVDDEKHPYFALATIYLLPGWVGLNVVECFAYGVPMVATDLWLAPVTEYIDNGVTGIVVKHNIAIYVKAVVDTLQNKQLINEMKKKCLKKADSFKISIMVNNFKNGIIKALAH